MFCGAWSWATQQNVCPAILSCSPPAQAISVSGLACADRSDAHAEDCTASQCEPGASDEQRQPRLHCRASAVASAGFLPRNPGQGGLHGSHWGVGGARVCESGGQQRRTLVKFCQQCTLRLLGVCNTNCEHVRIVNAHRIAACAAGQCVHPTLALASRTQKGDFTR